MVMLLVIDPSCSHCREGGSVNVVGTAVRGGKGAQTRQLVLRVLEELVPELVRSDEGAGLGVA